METGLEGNTIGIMIQIDIGHLDLSEMIEIKAMEILFKDKNYFPVITMEEELMKLKVEMLYDLVIVCELLLLSLFIKNIFVLECNRTETILLIIIL